MKKMVLLPYDRYQRLLSTSASSVVESSSQPELTLQPESTPGTQVETMPEERSTNIEEKNDASKNSAEILILQLPKSMQHRARSLLHYIRPHVSWNDRGEVTIEERQIPGSNIVDLLKAYLKGYKDFRPPGQDAFGELLLKFNVPRSLLAPRVRHLYSEGNIRPLLQDNQQQGRGQLPPPPGIPLKRRLEDSVQQKFEWLRL